MLMLQRAISADDPASGKIEFPGGHRSPGETTLIAAKREWEEETGYRVPKGRAVASWDATNGVYRGHVWKIPFESDLDITSPRVIRDPDGETESVLWVHPSKLQHRRLRREVRTDAELVRRAVNA